MALNVVQKILDEHIVEGEPNAGSEVGIRIDQTLTQDATGTMAYFQLEALDVDRVGTELSVSYVDHNTIQMGPENADDHAYLKSVAARYGVVFSRPGNGICHQVHLERFGAPGRTLLGSDSHTPTGGGLGMFAVGAGGLDVACAMAGHPFYMKYPEVMNVILRGELSPRVSAKDVILHILGVLTTKGNVGTVLEYSGPAVKSLSVEQRATITNMGAETGVTTSVFPSDEETKRFLSAQKRVDTWRELTADADAPYARTLEVDLSSIVPMAARPHSPGNTIPVDELEGLGVDQIVIGSCTNSSVRDLSAVADILRGNKVHPDTGLVVVPGSRQTLSMITASGVLASLVDAGARVLEPTCGFCIGSGIAPGSGAVSLRTSNRNFEGRCGTADGQVYLVSPETAAASAVTGRLTDPRTLDGPVEVTVPDDFSVDDGMFIFPPDDGRNVEIKRPPHMGELPVGTELADSLEAAVVIKVGDSITTDHIAPGGAYLKFRSNIEKYAGFIFEKVDPGFVQRCIANRDAGKGSVIVAGESYGQGSSREHAALCPAWLGVRVVIAKSLERIHAANLISFGILPLVFDSGGDYDKLFVNNEITLSGIREALESGEVTARCGDGGEIILRCQLSVRQRDILIAGGTLAYLRKMSNG